ncbi:leucyl/phenylalanyl-tRNA--protein transferase [Thermostilla marina]
MSLGKLPESRYFPPAEDADMDGIVCIGGELSPDWLIDAYVHGIFPWPFDENFPIPWCSPDPRGIIPLDGYHFSRSLCRLLRKRHFEVTCDRAFRRVLRHCADAHGGRDHTWLTDAMIDAYDELHHIGFAHSVEAWFEGKLVGGVYGVAIGGLFAAESMFYLLPNASKVALAHLLIHVRRRGYRLFDIQMVTPHTRTFGGIEISRSEYLQRLAFALEVDIDFGRCLEWSEEDFRTARGR